MSLPEPQWVDGKNVNSEECILRVFPLQRRFCIACALDYLWQAYDLAGGRMSLYCSDRCKALADKRKQELINRDPF